MKCAFPNQAEPPKELEIVMKSIIQKCDGLPLTLEVLGKYLKRIRDVEHWEETLNALRSAEEISGLNERLWEKLRPSFDDLKDMEKQIFLDATTFFCTSFLWTLRDAIAAWRTAYGVSGKVLCQTLVDRSLLYSVGEDDTIRVHEQLCSLGQKTASEPSNAGKCRVWDPDVAWKMLETSTEEFDGKEIHALRWRVSNRRYEHEPNAECIHLGKATLSKLKKVKFLDAHGHVTIDGTEDAASVPTKVVLLKCEDQELSNPILETNLAILDLTWDFSKDPLPHSIGQLQRLEHLKITDYFATTLPDSFGQLKGLQCLTVGNAEHLKNLPESFGQLSSLSYLRFDLCYKLYTLPESFGELKALCSLEFVSCGSLESFPKSFGYLKALNSLKVWDAPKLYTLPESFGQLCTLTELDFQCESLRYLPESFGQVTKLQRLWIDADNMERWPDSFGDLKGLRDLEILYNPATSIPDCIKILPSLHRLELWFEHDRVEPLPPWLVTPKMPRNIIKFSVMVFHVQDGCFFYRENESRMAG